LAVLKGYFDKSETSAAMGTPTCCVGGYIGDEYHWEYYLDYWPMALANSEVAYYHGKEFLDPDGPYKKWHPLPEHRAEINGFIADLSKVIGQAGLRGFTAIVRLPDLEKFNNEKRLALEAYPLAVYGCMIAISTEYLFEPMEIFFDHGDEAPAKLLVARRYADTDSYYKDENFARIQMNALTEYYNFKRVIELQAADYIVGDFRKQHLSVDEWWKIENKPQTFEARGKHFDEWSEKKYGPKPQLRKSLDAVVERTPHALFVWDYAALCEAHQLRGGVWA
jgi:hypothetical protein